MSGKIRKSVKGAFPHIKFFVELLSRPWQQRIGQPNYQNAVEMQSRNFMTKFGGALGITIRQ